MANEATVVGARKTTVGDNGRGSGKALSREKLHGFIKLSHTRATLGTFITDYNYMACFYSTCFDRFNTLILGIETYRFTGKPKNVGMDGRWFRDCRVRSKITAQDGQTSNCEDYQEYV
jgi:hypothetical protein